MRLRIAATSLLVLFTVIVVWHFATASHLVSSLTPTPLGVWQRLVEEATHPGDLARHLWASLKRVAAGFFLASIIGIPLGFLLGRSPLMRQSLDPFIQILRPVSPLAWLPIGLALLRDAEHTAIFVIVCTAVWPTLLNTIEAVRSVNPTYLKLASTLGSSQFLRLTYVWLPAILPGVVTGLRLSLSTSWLVIIAAEMLVGGSGIGYYVWSMWNRLDIHAIVVAILVIGATGMILDHLIAALQKAVKYD